ncbi:MAG: hypothetical protein QF492_05510 [Candidatus Krumholzibacteria bacterium]|nr:hypothetical protein [Candidatus Krumholzibacteria bacterium]MDP6796242.1 hypothetical protein [Candidatus Krumholzibacteria bacterium]MDP7020993.1 hypothetical protein [Candidatus Krumholzibacteria bacterium]
MFALDLDVLGPILLILFSILASRKKKKKKEAKQPKAPEATPQDTGLEDLLEEIGEAFPRPWKELVLGEKTGPGTSPEPEALPPPAPATREEVPAARPRPLPVSLSPKPVKRRSSPWNAGGLKAAILAREVLGPPRALQGPDSPGGS